MSALDLSRCETTIRRCVATLLHASYTDHEPTETTDAWRAIAADASRDLTDMIRRLRAAEARTAWQPIETAPPLEEGALGPWVQVWGVRFGRRKPDVHLARLDGIGWGDRDGNSVRPLLWAPAMDAPLPAAPEAPHV